MRVTFIFLKINIRMTDCEFSEPPFRYDDALKIYEALKDIASAEIQMLRTRFIVSTYVLRNDSNSKYVNVFKIAQ